ncbi:ParB/RepB/Spo0J family partition protein [Candidatus Hydrogenosomobacter endosymbioticus]|uniref:HTH cro/C1-type domain-containing protein n=1 Tax=Candidatus Hydrogenosomobacter endosymbioticus TaxID=2558174 RepID=A0ABN6L2X6_9PROT|nr:ParB/RepB/Spo0J family partition protein [Candidatus Hydrogenosomobacter endosymbioticus]BDB96235.1 hypothetical protein HYD_3680 [Candidatus Hydrogenosomobacter endosymbioticus]
MSDQKHQGQRRALGRGLSALFNDEEEELLDSEKLMLVSADEIKANPNQPRSTFDEISLGELALSIKENGVLQPLLVRRVNGLFELIAGERRLRAAISIGIDKIPCRVIELDDKRSLEVAILENVQRDDLNAIEEALGYKRLIEEFNYTQEDLAQRIGKSRSYLTNILRLLSLPANIQLLIRDEKLSTGHAKVLVSANDPEKITDEILRNNWTVRQTEERLRSVREKRRKSNKNLAHTKISTENTRSVHSEKQDGVIRSEKAQLFNEQTINAGLWAESTGDEEEAQVCAEQLAKLTGLPVIIDIKKCRVTFIIKTADELDEFMRKLNSSIDSA